jgi:hypothetical protein
MTPVIIGEKYELGTFSFSPLSCHFLSDAKLLLSGLRV